MVADGNGSRQVVEMGSTLTDDMLNTLPGCPVGASAAQTLAFAGLGGQRISLSDRPRLRTPNSSAHLPLGKVTNEEAIWGVIITMGITGLRNFLLVHNDFTWYLLHFYCLYDPVYCSMRYSERFNDTDFFHRSLWALFTVGLAGQVVFLGHNLTGFVAATGLLYGLIAMAELRVAHGLPRARRYALFWAGWDGLAVALFVLMSLYPAYEKVLLEFHVVFRPAGILVWNSLLYVWLPEERRRVWAVPGNIEYLVARLEGLYMMIIVCSVLFPLALAGDAFLSSFHDAAVVLLANLYALVTKLTFIDLRLTETGLGRHALQRSPGTKVAFVLAYPFGILGIACTGVGFVAGVKDAQPSLVRRLLCGAPCLTWGALALIKALHKAAVPRVHRAKVGVYCVGSVAFLVPLLVEDPGVLAVSVHLVCVSAACLATQLILQWCMTGELPKAWRWRRPELVVCLEGQRPSLQSAGRGTDKGVSSQEHFFTVLVAVAVFKLNINLQLSKDLEWYLVYFFIFYGIIWASMHYASRFNDDDAAHKLLWSLFEYALLLILLGLTADGAGHASWSLLKLSTAGMFSLLALGFFARVSSSLQQARRFTHFIMLKHLVCAALILATVPLDPASSRPLFWACVAALMGGDVAFELFAPKQGLVPMNSDYLISRFNGIYMEVIGVAIIVPNAIYPGSFAYPSMVATGDILAVLFAICLKTAIFDVEPADHKKHALKRGRQCSLAFLHLSCATILALALMGAGTMLLITSTGAEGPHRRTPFHQDVLCGACATFWGSLTLVKLLHDPISSVRVHRAKATVQAVATLASLLPTVVEISDMACLWSMVGEAYIVVWAQILLNGVQCSKPVPEHFSTCWSEPCSPRLPSPATRQKLCSRSCAPSFAASFAQPGSSDAGTGHAAPEPEGAWPFVLRA